MEFVHFISLQIYLDHLYFFFFLVQMFTNVLIFDQDCYYLIYTTRCIHGRRREHGLVGEASTWICKILCKNLYFCVNI